ncbi:hypothetical protein FHS85_004259 [Rhodoligotrophos appendicifer]|uniref:Zn-ribbon domain-containing OB-fold protein n=1 Tax=Rhodoligotrophos appendicifer TaxID=987056 RepID=UPI001184A12C|nr:OB-fold domain-containing protein [Rhodoligotrophos appendicifer]
MDEPHSPLIIPGTWNFEYRYFAGDAATRFFAEIRDNRRIMGTRNPVSGQVMVPARGFSDADYVAATEWVETGPEGVLEVFSIIGTKFPGLPDPPFTLGYVTLDGADTAVLNYITGVDLTDIDAAAEILLKRPRVRAIFKEQREGRITDFHFEVIET